MAEPTYIYRIPPCPEYDIEAMEAWLEDMAAQGLHLAQDGFFLGVASFEKGPPRKEKFRLEATATNGGLLSEEYAPDDDAVQMNQQMGWTYRARRGQFHIYSAADPDAPELNTDPVVQAMTIGALGKYLRRTLFHTLFLAALYFVLHFNNILFTSAVCLGSPLVGLVALLLVWDFLREVRRLVTLARLRRRLQSGEALSHRSDYGRHGLLHPVLNGLRVVLWVFAVGALLLRLGSGLVEEDAVALEGYTGDYPFSTLSELYPDARVKPLSGILDSQVTVWSDPLAPENYDYSEYAALEFADGTTADCYYTVNYHRTRWEWTAAALAREFVGRAGANPVDQFIDGLFDREPVTATELAIGDADYAAYYYEYREPYLVLQMGNVVVRANVDFIGGPQIGDLEALAAAILDGIE